MCTLNFTRSYYILSYLNKFLSGSGRSQTCWSPPTDIRTPWTGPIRGGNKGATVIGPRVNGAYTKKKPGIVARFVGKIAFEELKKYIIHNFTTRHKQITNEMIILINRPWSSNNNIAFLKAKKKCFLQMYIQCDWTRTSSSLVNSKTKVTLVLFVSQ